MTCTLKCTTFTYGDTETPLALWQQGSNCNLSTSYITLHR